MVGVLQDCPTLGVEVGRATCLGTRATGMEERYGNVEELWIAAFHVSQDPERVLRVGHGFSYEGVDNLVVAIGRDARRRVLRQPL